MDELATITENLTALIARSDLDLDALSDEELIRAQETLGRARRAADVAMLLLVRETVRRSSPDFGHAGMAARLGFGSVEALLRAKAGLTAEQAAKYIAVGSALHTHAGAAVLAGTISVDAAYAIQQALPTSKGVAGV